LSRHNQRKVIHAPVTRVIVVFYAAVPLSIGIAILKYRLYDTDNVIRKVLIMACRGLFVFVYAVVVGGIAALLESSATRPCRSWQR